MHNKVSLRLFVLLASTAGAATAQPTQEVIPEVTILCGSGRIEDILTGDPIQLDRSDMVHVLILPEGYRSADLELGVFDQDVEDWIAEWAIIEPYATFREAFCVWKMPVISNQHVAARAPQTADTAFRVPITADGDGVHSNIPLSGPTAERVWAVVQSSFPFPPKSFYPPGGRTSRIAKNLVVVVLVYDKKRGRSGLSGRARRLQNPADSTQRLSVAFAHNRPHEFSHAFSRLNDEYLEDCCGPLCSNVGATARSDNLTNVVCSPQCDSLPWTHLLVGKRINPSAAGLVGAFGIPEVGYHSELKCLMNGRHDNAVYYGGDGRLRVDHRLCNFCMEVTAFRLFERIHILDDPNTSYRLWIATYRKAFFDRFSVLVPVPVPQENSAGVPIFEGCEVKPGGLFPIIRHNLAELLGHTESCDIIDER